MSAIQITLNQIREKLPCSDGWQKLLTSKGKTKADDEPFPLTDVLDSNGMDDCLWCLRCLPEHDRLWRRLAVYYARSVQHLMTDQRSLDALDVADRHWQGLATDEELAAAGAAARAAAGAAARDAAGDAARAAAWAVAWAVARDAQPNKLRAILTAGEWV